MSNTQDDGDPSQKKEIKEPTFPTFFETINSIASLFDFSPG
jgi:hypothetical protein